MTCVHEYGICDKSCDDKNAEVGLSDSTALVMPDEALKWRIRFKTPDGMYTHTSISKRGGLKLSRDEVSEWADMLVRTSPDKYASVDEILNMDADGA